MQHKVTVVASHEMVIYLQNPLITFLQMISHPPSVACTNRSFHEFVQEI